MNKFLRAMLLILRSRRGARLGPLDVSRLPMRVRPSDIDNLRHMNNGVYLSIADLGRMDLLIRTGIWAVFQREGWYPVVASATISYRKSLDLWQRYVLESRMVGLDERSVYLEQRFTVDGEIYARLLVRGRFLRRGGGGVTAAEIARTLGIAEEALPVPQHVERWSGDFALPSTKQPAPSDWA